MIHEDALLWVIRTRDPEFVDWEGFTAWLEIDPAHAAAYDALMAQDASLDEIIPAEPVHMPAPANDAGDPVKRGWRPMRWFGGGAVAAALAAAVSLGVMNRSDIYTVTTAPGETRSIALDDGTKIDVNGGTTLRLDRKNLRFAALDKGEAAFTVRHDEANPFRVTVGDDLFEDAGTVFNIVRSDASTRIGVSEGKVIYNPRAEAIALPAGRALTEDASGVKVMNIVPEAVASWRSGRLVYANVPISEVGEDIARSIGVRLTATPGAAAMRFTGTIALDKDPARFFSGAAPLMGLTAVRQGDGWLLKEGDGPQS
ncbi:MAG: FecR domain-containing protein [Sphingobium sp.]